MTDLSIVVPVFNEEKNIGPFYQELSQILKRLKKSYEVIFVSDGSADQTQTVLEQLSKNNPQVKTIGFHKNFGKGSALKAGFNRAEGEIIVTMDGDLQDNPQDIPRLINQLGKGFDFVSGWRKKRLAPFIKRITSRLLNWTVRLIFKIEIHDINSSLKAYKKEAAKSLNIYGEQHRFIPILVDANGYKITEIPVDHRQRKFGKTKYGNVRFFHAFFDLLTVLLLTRYYSKPFRLIGSIIFLIGFITIISITLSKLFQAQFIFEEFLLDLSRLLMIIGVQVILTGLLAELIVTLKQK